MGIPKKKLTGWQNREQTYSSAPTRFFSLDAFLGEGKINETVPSMERSPCDKKLTSLRNQFKSNLPKTNLPKANGLKFDRIPIMGKRGTGDV